MRHRIAVVGGGPGGLTFARVLHRRGHPVTVFERDPSPAARPPGGTLDLHEKLGQLALDKAGLLAEFQALSRPEGQAMRILDTDGTVLRDWPARTGDHAHPEIDRGQLRDLLLGPLDVRWGRSVTEVAPRTPDGVLVRFADGQPETFDLVVGADGAWSRVRPAVSPATPQCTGVTVVETSLDDVDTRHPGLARLIGDGSLAVYGVNRALVAQRNSGGHVKVYAQFRAPLDWHAGLDLADAEAVRSSLLALFDGWAVTVLDLLRHGTAFAHRPLYVLPVSHTWTHVPGVTLLGDAAHLMPPLGAGANLAMLDGAELAETVADSSGLGPADLDKGVRAREEQMLTRAGKWAQITTEGLERLVSPDPAEAVALFDEVQLSWLTASIPPGPEAVLPERYSSVVDVHVILRRDGKILLLRRAGDVYATGLLCLPSGHLERGEHVLAAAVRETREETGIALDPAITSLVLSIHQRYPEADHARVGFAFEPSRWQGEPVIGEPDKCSELIWANPDSLPGDTMDYAAAVIRAVQGGHSFAINGW